MSKKKKKYEGRFYGMRMENYRDKNIKNILTNLSKRKNIPVNRLIWNLLEKGLVLSEEKEIYLDKTKINENFKVFLHELFKKIQNLENKLLMKNFEKKESLRYYISKKLPNKIQKKKFYLELIESQISCECDLLWEFFTLYDYESKKHVGYFKFLSQKENIPFNADSRDKILLEYQIKLYSRWLLELRTAGIITDLEKFKEIKTRKEKFEDLFNYKALKYFIFDLYKGRKLLYSLKEEIKHTCERLQREHRKKPKKGSLSNDLKSLFRELVKYHIGLSNEILNVEQEAFQIFHKVGYKPHIFYDILDLDEYIRFIDENNLRKSLSYSIDQRQLFYIQLNEFYSFPPREVIQNINFFFSYLKEINQFLENLPNLAIQKAYSEKDIYKIGRYLKTLKQNEDNQSWCKKMLDKIPNINISELGEIMPQNYHQRLSFIKKYLE